MSNNCQIPTPIEYVNSMLDFAGYKSELYGKSVLENSCGEGNILCEIVKRYIEDARLAGYSKNEITAGLERDIEAYEIDDKKVNICIKNLNGILEKYDMDSVMWNIHSCDYLKSRAKKYCYIIGNPPYITYHDLDEEQRSYLSNEYESCKKGRFDYCYAFIEKSLESLNQNGTLVYLVPYSIIKNKFGAQLRDIMKPYISEIHDYSGIKIFPEAITSSIILIFKKKKNGDGVQYYSVKEDVKKVYNRNALNDKWLFDKETNRNRRFGDYFDVCNSVATLLNEAFILENYEENENYFFVGNNRIEKEIVYPAISTKSINKSLRNECKKLFIIFPYKNRNGGIEHIEEGEFEKEFPGAAMYLKTYRIKLDNRKKDKNAKWYEYGRSQALTRVFGEKLIMPMVITNNVILHYGAKQAIPYAGYFIKCRKGSNMLLSDAKHILESKEFFEYVKKNGTPTTTTSYRISVNDIKEYKF